MAARGENEFRALELLLVSSPSGKLLCLFGYQGNDVGD